MTLFDGSYHDVDSNEMAFKIAASMGFKEAIAKPAPVLLEPIMKVEVVTPEDYIGDVIGDLNRRRGQIMGMEESSAARWSLPKCRWPRCSVTRPSMRSMSQGRATYTMEFAKYARSPEQRRGRGHDKPEVISLDLLTSRPFNDR